jgi:hypothetical protein
MNKCDGGPTAPWSWGLVQCGRTCGDHRGERLGTVVDAVADVMQAFTTLLNRTSDC